MRLYYMETHFLYTFPNTKVVSWAPLVLAGSDVTPEVNVSKDKFNIKLRFQDGEDMELACSSVSILSVISEICGSFLPRHRTTGLMVGCPATDWNIVSFDPSLRRANMPSGWQHFVWHQKARPWLTVAMRPRFQASRLFWACSMERVTPHPWVQARYACCFHYWWPVVEQLWGVGLQRLVVKS